MRRGSQRPQKLKFISNSQLYNIIHRDVPQNQKFSFILYDLIGQYGDWPNNIDIQDAIEPLVQNNENPKEKIQNLKNLINKDNFPEGFEIKDLEKHMISGKWELFDRRKRMFNIIIPFQNLNEGLLEKMQKYVYQCNDKDDELCVCQKDWEVKEFMEKFSEFLIGEQNIDKELIQESMEQIYAFQAGLNLFRALKNDKTTEVYILLDNFSEFNNNYEYMSDFFNALEIQREKLNVYPNEILPNQLYLGKDAQSSDLDILKNLGITHIVNMTKEVPNYFENHKDVNITYLKNPLDDEIQSNIIKYFENTYEHINSILQIDQISNESSSKQQQQNVEENSEEDQNNTTNNSTDDINQKNEKVLIHCAHGKSRSATIVIMYLMKTYKWTYKQAYNYVKQRRECIEPNFGFQKQLEKFEENSWEFS